METKTSINRNQKFIPCNDKIAYYLNSECAEICECCNINIVSIEKFVKIIQILINYVKFLGVGIYKVNSAAFRVEDTELTVFGLTIVGENGSANIYVAENTIVTNFVRVLIHEIGHYYMVTCFGDWGEASATLMGMEIFVHIFKNKDIIDKEECNSIINCFIALGIAMDQYLGSTGDEIIQKIEAFTASENIRKENHEYLNFLKKEQEFRETF